MWLFPSIFFFPPPPPPAQSYQDNPTTIQLKESGDKTSIWSINHTHLPLHVHNNLPHQYWQTPRYNSAHRATTSVPSLVLPWPADGNDSDKFESGSCPPSCLCAVLPEPTAWRPLRLSIGLGKTRPLPGEYHVQSAQFQLWWPRRKNKVWQRRRCKKSSTYG